MIMTEGGLTTLPKCVRHNKRKNRTKQSTAEVISTIQLLSLHFIFTFPSSLSGQSKNGQSAEYGIFPQSPFAVFLKNSQLCHSLDAQHGHPAGTLSVWGFKIVFFPSITACLLLILCISLQRLSGYEGCFCRAMQLLERINICYH